MVRYSKNAISYHICIDCQTDDDYPLYNFPHTLLNIKTCGKYITSEIPETFMTVKETKGKARKNNGFL